jgi:hypothetical protein
MKTDKDKFLELLAVLCVQFEKVIDPAIQNHYWASLKRFKHLEDPEQGMYFPKIAHLMKYLQVTVQTQALIAWGTVLEAVRGLGSYGNPGFNDPVIAQAIRCMGGWKAFCQFKESELSFKQREFVDLYNAQKDKYLIDQGQLEHEPTKTLYTFKNIGKADTQIGNQHRNISKNV